MSLNSTCLIFDWCIWRLALELREESRVLAPEESDVGNIIELHGQSLQTETKCPADLILCSSCVQRKKEIDHCDSKF